MDAIDSPAVDDLLRSALAEDLGAGDITTLLSIPENASSRAEVTAKQAATIAGMPLLTKICAVSGGGIEVVEKCADGDSVAPGHALAELEGPAGKLLSIERVLLNLMQHLSGVATLTADFVAAVRGCGCRIVDTRKTLPGLRCLQKYAVRMGGGANHRMRLDDGILIKENHIAVCGSLAAAVTAVQAGAPHGLKIEVECQTLAQVSEALTVAADTILLDNMTIEEMEEAVHKVGGRALVEASGGVNIESVRAIAETGVDLISVGALTHSAPAVDLSMILFL